MEDNRSFTYPEEMLGAYLHRREGRIWRPKDTAFLIRRAEQIDDLVESLMIAAGIQVIKAWPAAEADL